MGYNEVLILMRFFAKSLFGTTLLVINKKKKKNKLDLKRKMLWSKKLSNPVWVPITTKKKKGKTIKTPSQNLILGSFFSKTGVNLFAWGVS